MNWDGLRGYVRAARASRKLGTEPPPEPDALRVDMRRVMAYRATVQDLKARLEPDAHVFAAYGGLQDSAPRAALFALHARMRDVGPDAWEHPSLVQLWFRLGAVYVVPGGALDEFTIGAMPYDAKQIAALNDLGDLVRNVVADQPKRSRDVVRALGDRIPDWRVVRYAPVSGKIVIRWDARTTEVIASDDPQTDPEKARLDLARRFVHWYGPAGPMHLARWAALPKDVAQATWDALRSELVPVDIDGRGRWILASDESTLRDATPPIGVRLLPAGGDPYLYFDHAPAPSTPPVGPDVSQRLVNSMVCRVMLDGELVAAWGRSGPNVTIYPWRTLSDEDVTRITDEAASFSGPLGKPARIRWLR